MRSSCEDRARTGKTDQVQYFGTDRFFELLWLRRKLRTNSRKLHAPFYVYLQMEDLMPSATRDRFSYLLYTIIPKTTATAAREVQYLPICPAPRTVWRDAAAESGSQHRNGQSQQPGTESGEECARSPSSQSKRRIRTASSN